MSAVFIRMKIPLKVANFSMVYKNNVMKSVQHKTSLCYEDFKYISHQKYKKLLKLNMIICALYHFLHLTKVMSLFS